MLRAALNNCYKFQVGFTLLEVLISLIILSVGLLAVAGMHITSIRGNSFSHHLTQAVVLAESKLEDLKNLAYENPGLRGGQPAEQIMRSGVLFTRQYAIAALGTSMKMISVTVGWTDRTDHQIILSTIRSRQQ